MTQKESPGSGNWVLLPSGSAVKNPPVMQETACLQYSCLGNPMVNEDWGRLQSIVSQVGHSLGTTPLPQKLNELGIYSSSSFFNILI